MMLHIMQQAASVQCPICLDEPVSISSQCSVTCGHVFCTHCIMKWASRSASCPMCTTRIYKLECMASKRSIVQIHPFTDQVPRVRTRLNRVVSVACTDRLHLGDRILHVNDKPLTGHIDDVFQSAHESKAMVFVEIVPRTVLLFLHGGNVKISTKNPNHPTLVSSRDFRVLDDAPLLSVDGKYGPELDVYLKALAFKHGSFCWCSSTIMLDGRHLRHVMLPPEHVRAHETVQTL